MKQEADSAIFTNKTITGNNRIFYQEPVKFSFYVPANFSQSPRIFFPASHITNLCVFIKCLIIHLHRPGGYHTVSKFLTYRL